MLGGRKLIRDPSSWAGIIDSIYSVSLSILIVSIPIAFQSELSTRFDAFLFRKPGSSHYYFHGFGPVFFILLILSLFFVLFDSWSLLKFQINHSKYVDRFHCICLYMTLFSSLLISVFYLGRLDTAVNNDLHFTGELRSNPFPLLALLLIHYSSILLPELKLHKHSTRNLLHRTKRVSLFSVHALIRRIYVLIIFSMLIFSSIHLGFYDTARVVFPIVYTLLLFFEKSILASFSRLFKIIFLS